MKGFNKAISFFNRKLRSDLRPFEITGNKVTPSIVVGDNTFLLTNLDDYTKALSLDLLKMFKLRDPFRKALKDHISSSNPVVVAVNMNSIRIQLLTANFMLDQELAIVAKEQKLSSASGLSFFFKTPKLGELFVKRKKITV